MSNKNITTIGGELWSSGRLSYISLVWIQRSIVVLSMKIILLLATNTLYTIIPIVDVPRYSNTG